uniref:Uncharacterized protein n=1 Tax=Arundo donax TaxID=35708 RepID=A0A0A9G3W5_ARUDO
MPCAHAAPPVRWRPGGGFIFSTRPLTVPLQTLHACASARRGEFAMLVVGSTCDRFLGQCRRCL